MSSVLVSFIEFPSLLIYDCHIVVVGLVDVRITSSFPLFSCRYYFFIDNLVSLNIMQRFTG